jgi:hypothetical protein
MTSDILEPEELAEIKALDWLNFDVESNRFQILLESNEIIRRALGKGISCLLENN